MVLMKSRNFVDGRSMSFVGFFPLFTFYHGCVDSIDDCCNSVALLNPLHLVKLPSCSPIKRGLIVDIEAYWLATLKNLYFFCEFTADWPKTFIGISSFDTARMSF